MSTARHRWTLAPSRRLRVTGRLRMQSALHVGGGVGTQSITDAGVLRHRDGRPYIPGSSMKGVLRSHLERLARAPALQALGVRSCALYQNLDPDCPSPTWIEEGNDSTSATENDFEALCHTCTLFGSPILAGKVRVPDLEVDPLSFAGSFEIRDGVGIDRDRGQAVDRIKFDYEVVPVGTTFQFEWIVDSPDPVEQALVAIAVREMQQGYVAVGGMTTRGLGACRLDDVAIYDLDLGDTDALRAHLLRQAPEPVGDVEAFLTGRIQTLFDG